MQFRANLVQCSFRQIQPSVVDSENKIHDVFYSFLFFIFEGILRNSRQPFICCVMK